MIHHRAAGIILHPTSLPGPYGIGDVGPAAKLWIDLLAETGTHLWQVLPLGPVGAANSPYASPSAVAANPLLISPDWLTIHGLTPIPEPPYISDQTRVDYPRASAWKVQLIAQAAGSFFAGKGDPELKREYERFCETHSWWLDDYTLYAALKEEHGGKPWTEWEPDLKNRNPSALNRARNRTSKEIRLASFTQFLIHSQWAEVRVHAAERSVRIIGDLPIYVAHDSADVWTHPHLFALTPEGRPRLVGGVPPDQFSDEGQIWGNPTYHWDQHAAEDYTWWTRRIQATLTNADIIRIDHFRAFADYWELPADAPNAINGAWQDGPGQAFFDTVETELGPLPVIAEDMGANSDKVVKLLETTGYPGMRLLQFAWDTDETHPFLPHNDPENTVAYTGTHDNDTTLGWWCTATLDQRRAASDYLNIDPADPVAAFLQTLWGSHAETVIIPFQDLLRLDSNTRMNTPGTTTNNWQWRTTPHQHHNRHLDELTELNLAHKRSTR